jgi:serine/threonine protein kinase
LGVTEPGPVFDSVFNTDATILTAVVAVTCTGTVAYMPKELLLSGRMTQATDIYSFGLMSE